MTPENSTYHEGEWIYSGSGSKKRIKCEELMKKKNLTPIEKQELAICKKLMVRKNKKIKR